jgi:hypothetical protein
LKLATRASFVCEHASAVLLLLPEDKLVILVEAIIRLVAPDGVRVLSINRYFEFPPLTDVIRSIAAPLPNEPSPISIRR